MILTDSISASSFADLSATSAASPWIRCLAADVASRALSGPRGAEELLTLLDYLTQRGCRPFISGGAARALVLSTATTDVQSYDDVDVFVGPGRLSCPNGWTELPNVSSYPQAFRVWNSPSGGVQLIQTSESDPARVVEQFDFANVMAWVPIDGPPAALEAFYRAESSGVLDGSLSALAERPDRFMKRALKWAARTGFCFSSQCIDAAFEAFAKSEWKAKDAAQLAVPLFPLSMAIELAGRAGYKDPLASKLVRANLQRRPACNRSFAVLQSL